MTQVEKDACSHLLINVDEDSDESDTESETSSDEDEDEDEDNAGIMHDVHQLIYSGSM